MKNVKTKNGHATVEVKKDSTVILKSTETHNLYSVSYQNNILGHIDISDADDVRFVPLPKKNKFSIIELEQITMGLKKARQMKLQIMNTIENFLS